jgi:hypothetical protein
MPMPMQNLGSLRPGNTVADIVSLELRRLEAGRRTAQDQIADLSAVSVEAERERLAQEIADIKDATAALRRGEPLLSFGIDLTPEPDRKPRPIWRVIMVLWVSAVLLAAGAVVAMATFA